jgi:hypothetical protein
MVAMMLTSGKEVTLDLTKLIEMAKNGGSEKLVSVFQKMEKNFPASVDDLKEMLATSDELRRVVVLRSLFSGELVPIQPLDSKDVSDFLDGLKILSEEERNSVWESFFSKHSPENDAWSIAVEWMCAPQDARLAGKF